MSKGKPFPTIQELAKQADKLVAIFNREDDLSAALIGGAYLDHCLAALLQARLLDGTTSKNLLQPGKTLGDNYSRAALSYCLGLIPAELFNELQSIAKIRNLFAHGLFDKSFTDDDVVAECKNLKFTTTEKEKIRFTISVCACILCFSYVTPRVTHFKAINEKWFDSMKLALRDIKAQKQET